MSQQLSFPAIGTFNGFNQHLNVIECINVGGEEGFINVRVLGNDSGILGEQRLFVPASGSPHLVLNQFPITDRTGTFIITPVPDEEEQLPSFKLNCYTVVYRMAPAGSEKELDYAFVLPVSAPLRGVNSGVFNSIRPDGAEAPVLNWLSIFNPNEEQEDIVEGIIKVYDQNGDFAKNVSFGPIAPGARQDFPLGHEEGQVVGTYQVILFDTELPYGAFLTRYSPSSAGRFNFAFPLTPQEGSCDSGPLPASTMDPAINWGEIANPARNPVQVRVEVRNQLGALLLDEVRLIGGFSQEHVYLNQYLGERSVGTFRVRCVNEEQAGDGVITASLFYGQNPANPTEVDWAYASQSRSVFGRPGDSVAAPVNTHFGAANWFKVLNATESSIDIQHSVYGIDGIKLDAVPSAPAQKSLFGLQAFGNTDISVHSLSGAGFVGSASACSWTEESEYAGELLRVFPKTEGGIGYIMPVPAVQVRNALNADARELHVSVDKNTTVGLTASNEERLDDSFRAYISRQPENGRVYGSWPNYTYDPDDRFRGEDFFEFRVFDGTTWSRPGRVFVSVDRHNSEIGVPAPSFGISEAAAKRPSPWSSEVAGFYYVDSYHPQASDAGNTYGSPTRPRQTIPDSLAPGSYVELHGLYDYTQNGAIFSITSNGTENQPIFIRGISSDEKPRITRPWHVSGSYLILENLHFDRVEEDRGEPSPVGSLAIFGPAHHVALRYSELEGNNEGGGVDIFGFLGTSVRDITLYDNDIHDIGRRYSNIVGQTVHDGVSILGGSENIWLLRNDIDRAGGYGVYVGAESLAEASSLHHVYISENDIVSNRYGGVWVEHASDVVVSRNTLRYHRPSSIHIEDQRSAGACLGYQYAPSRLWMLNNNIHECEVGIFGDSHLAPGGGGAGEDTVIMGNVFRDIRNSGENQNGVFRDGAAIRLIGESARSFILHNTFENSHAGVMIPGARSSFIIANNIFRNIANEDIYLEQPQAAAVSFVHNSLFDAPNKIKWGSGTSRDLAGFQVATGQCVGCVQGDPRFENEGGNDFDLLSGSPAINAGDLGVLSLVQQRFLSLYGLELSEDRKGNERVQGEAPDTGAYEFVPE